MAGNNIKVTGQVDLQLNLSAQTAKKELAQLQKSLQAVSNIEIKAGAANQLGEVGAKIREASQAAMQLQSHLTAATNVNTGNLDFSKFSQSLGRDGKALAQYRDALVALGPQGKSAFMGLANSIAKSEIPLRRTNTLLDSAWANLKRTAGWQLSSSIIHGLIGSMQQAVGYAKDLDRSLNDIRIVTGSSSEQMAQFALQANKAAKNLSTTTTEYTKASLIYYQQGLSDAEVKARTETTIKMANATGTSAQKVSDQMTAVWNNYDNGTKSLQYYADAMAALGASTASSTDEIAQGLQKFASISQTVGLSYEYAAAALATVTSTSRESADVVGNAFKTLFARIQGLQLGETLEDGTDLNKYSQALNKVGISIKDANGNMKSMDNILSEMGGKWNTLGKDQQMALAQTVAGVRQYTQLMTLMNNWDFFQQNVMTAQNSTGTLDAQAAIFAESWQAASNRVRASFEGLWDSLINSDSFTTILDGFASIISLIEKMVDGLGGAGGTLAMFGGILGKVFTPQIAESVGSIASGIRQLSPKARAQDYALRRKWLENFYSMDSVAAGKAEAEVIDKQLNKYADESYRRDLYRSHMNARELDYDMRLEKALDLARTQEREAAAQVDRSGRVMERLVDQNPGLANILKQQYSSASKSAAVSSAESAVSEMEKDFFEITKDKNGHGFVMKETTTEETFRNYMNNMEKPLPNKDIDDLWKQSQQTYQRYRQAMGMADTIYGPSPIKQGTNKQMMEYAINEGANFRENFDKGFWDSIQLNPDGKKIIDFVGMQDAIINSAKGTKLNIDDVAERLSAIEKSGTGFEAQVDAIRTYANEISKRSMGAVIDDMNISDEMKTLLKKEYGIAYASNIQGQRNQSSSGNKAEELRRRWEENSKNSQSKLKLEGAVGVAQGASFMMAASQSFGALTDSIHGLIEGTNSFGNVLSSLTGSATSLLFGLSAMRNGFINMGGQFAANASKLSGRIAAAVVAISLVSGVIREVKEARNEENKETMKSTETEKKKTEANKKLIESVDEAANAYKQVQADYKDDKATIDEVGQAQSSMVTAASALQDSYGVNGLTAAALSGNAEELQSLQYEQRIKELKRLEDKYIAGEVAAAQYLKRNVSKKGLHSVNAIESHLKGGGIVTSKEKDSEAKAILDSFKSPYFHENLYDGATGDMTSGQSIAEYWNRLSSAVTAMEAAGINADNSAYYASAVKFIEANRANVEAYNKYADDMQALNIEREAITDGLYKIDNIQDFTTKRQNLIKKITKGMDEDSEDYKKAVNAVDAYLGTLSNVTDSKKGNMLTATQGMEDLYADYKAYNGEFGIDKDKFMSDLSALYDEYGNLIFSIDFELSFNDGQTMEEAIADQLSAIQQRSNVLTVEVALQTKDDIQSLLSQGGSTTDWNAINEQIRDEKIYGTDGTSKTAWETIMKNSPYGDLVAADGGLNLLPLLTMTESQMAEAMSYYQTQLNNNKYKDNGYIDTAIKANKDEINRLNEQNASKQGSILAYDQQANQAVKPGGIFSKSTTMFDSEKVESGQEINTLHATSSILYDYLNAVKGGDVATIPGLRADLIEQGYSEDYLSWLESENVSADLFNALLVGAQNYLQTQDNETKITNLKTENTELEGEKKDYQSAPGIFDIRQEAMDKGVDLNTLNELSQQYLTQSGFDYDPNISSENRQQIIDQVAADERLTDIDNAERIADGKIAEQESQIEAAQRRALAELETQQGIDELAKSYDDLSKSLKNSTKHSTEWNRAMVEMKKSLAKVLNIDDWTKLSDDFVEAADSAGLLKKAANGDAKAISDLREQNILLNEAMEQGLITQEQLAGMSYDEIVKATSDAFAGSDEEVQKWANNLTTVMDAIEGVNVGDLINGDTELTKKMMNVLDGMGAFSGDLSTLMDKCSQLGITPEIVGPFKSINEATMAGFEGEQIFKGQADKSYTVTNNVGDASTTVSGEGNFFGVRFTKNGGGGGSSSGGGGGGGGKEPKKVPQTRRSQVVKRYKNIDAKRSINKNRQSNMSNKTDKLYGESRITNLQKENKLLEEGLRLNEKKAEEALKNLKIDEESLRKMTKKYGYELELDSEGNITNYEEILGDIYDQLHALEADGEISEEEEKVKERLNIMKEEIEGAIEDWEDTIKQLEDLNNEYEETIDEMHSNELEQITYKLEFELELNELDSEWYDFLNEQIGDDFTQAVDTMDLITEKIKIANDNINLYKQSVTDLMENIENDPNRSLITGYLEDGVLTDEEAEILKEAYSGIIEQLSVLAEAKTSAEELLVSIFEGYKERIDLDTTALEHYTSLLEHFGNVVDIVGQKQLGLSDQFMENMAKMRIQQSRDIMSAAQSELDAYEQIRAEAEEELARAREEGRTNDIDYWQQQLDSANTSIQEARDKLVTSFENNLNAIADAFDKAVERIVKTFNDAVYAFGGLEGLSEDYSFIRENTELMAQDYEKIYELSKLNRNINKTLNDNNIIAGKQKMIELQKEINDLQASGAELSKYDLEYLQAKYELRLAEIELENAQNAKETVRLSKDSEGNWSYVYTASTEKIDEAQQKYEDALYKMQNLSYEYIDEMSEKIISASQAMMEEIQNLNKNNFENEQEYLAEINRIKAKYAESLGVTEEELNKALANNEELYDKDWQSYSNKTGYAISESQNWIDRYAESTLGTLMKSTSDVADYMNNFSIALDELTNSLYRVAGDYYNGIDDAFAAAGITKEDFASFVTTNTKTIMDASTNTKKDIETQTSTLVKEYSIQADKVTDIQRTLDTAIDIYGPYIREIRDLLKESAALTKELQGKDAIYTYQQAGELFNSMYGDKYKIEMNEDGVWTKQVEGVKRDILKMHSDATTDEEKRYFADMYTWLTSYILPYVTSLDTGGYTGEWGTSGRLAMLHEKELILNANDTANFLDALNVSKELVNRVIEMNARASSFGIGGLSPSSIQDFAQNLEQQVTITAEFPNAVDHNEIEEAFASLINTASQYANRK